MIYILFVLVWFYAFVAGIVFTGDLTNLTSAPVNAGQWTRMILRSMLWPIVWFFRYLDQ